MLILYVYQSTGYQAVRRGAPAPLQQEVLTTSLTKLPLPSMKDFSTRGIDFFDMITCDIGLIDR
jgi:hypothetical protein